MRLLSTIQNDNIYLNKIGIKIVNGVLSADHIHVFVSIPPHIAVSDFVKIAKGRMSSKIQQELPQLRK